MDCFISIVEEELKRLDGLYEKYRVGRDALEECRDLRLSVDRKPAEAKYYCYKKGERRKRYVGRKDLEMVRNVQNRRFYEEALKELGADRKRMERFLEEYRAFDAEETVQRLPQAYREFVDPYALTGRGDGAEWKRRMEAVKASGPAAWPESLKHHAADGTMMKSVSETEIALYLIERNYPYVYELPRKFGNRMRWPDFTVYIERQNRVKYIEFEGRMEDPGYEEQDRIKMSEYLNEGLRPNRDFLFLFGGPDGSLDMQTAGQLLALFLAA
ncbi:MAG: hypothetical protein IJH75_07710 [Mogibacterium sp.]|nr:hypothetical protein [Mogibacterium sp.]